MTKASLKLPNGTIVTIEGTPEEVKHLLELYSDEEAPQKKASKRKHIQHQSKSQMDIENFTEDKEDVKHNLNKIVTLTKDCDQAEAIEINILDRTSQVDRTLLPLYIVHEHLDNAFGLTSGDINKITTDLGIPISTSNASTTLAGTASKYVIGDMVKIKGQPVRYKLSRRGIKYIKEILAGKEDG